jgi:hypothetical protein
MYAMKLSSLLKVLVVTLTFGAFSTAFAGSGCCPSGGDKEGKVKEEAQASE